MKHPGETNVLMSMRHVKRWVLPLLMAIVLMAMVSGYILRDVYGAPFDLPAWAGSITLEFLPRLVRASLLALVGIALCGLCVTNLVTAKEGRFLRWRGGIDDPGGRAGS
jgi:hypothetical protein